MSRRTGAVVLVVGFLAVLGLAIGLTRLTRGSSPAAPGPVAARAPAADVPAPGLAEDAPPRPAPPAAREPRPTAAGRGRVAPTAQPTLAPPVTGFERPELKRDPEGHLVPMLSLRELRAMLPMAADAVNACLQRTGQHASGEATLSFTVVAKGHQLAIESTGVQDEKTLASAPELLTCLHKTADALVLAGHPVPELGTPIYVRREITLADGGLVGDTIASFSYNP